MNPFPMGRKFHNFRKRHSGDKHNALSSITEKTEGIINKIICIALFALTKGCVGPTYEARRIGVTLWILHLTFLLILKKIIPKF